jgi:hypothetical protein
MQYHWGLGIGHIYSHEQYSDGSHPYLPTSLSLVKNRRMILTDLHLMEWVVTVIGEVPWRLKTQNLDWKSMTMNQGLNGTLSPSWVQIKMNSVIWLRYLMKDWSCIPPIKLITE